MPRRRAFISFLKKKRNKEFKTLCISLRLQELKILNKHDCMVRLSGSKVVNRL